MVRQEGSESTCFSSSWTCLAREPDRRVEGVDSKGSAMDRSFE